jgi:hypothetical protein
LAASTSITPDGCARPAANSADAVSIFVPFSALPDAGVGDIIVVKGGAGSEERTGDITAIERR